MRENFKVLDCYTKTGVNSTRRFYKIQCSNFHVYEVRADTLKNLRLCKFCTNYYRSLNEYEILDGAKQRCSNPNNAKYKDYGARGIKVCHRWLEYSYFGTKNFIEDMGERPAGMTLDRIDTNGNYEPSNCRWASNSVQGFNQRKRVSNTSGVTGVSWDESREKWLSSITFNNKTIYLGRSDDFDLAVSIRKDAEIKYFGFSKI